MIKILMLILSAITIFIFVRYIQCSTWENLIENKKRDFTNKGLVNKQSVRLKQACASLLVVTIGLGFIGLPSGYSNNYVKNETSYDTAMEEEMMCLEESNEICNDAIETNDDFYIDLWNNNIDLNEYTKKYKLSEIVYLDVDNPIASFSITSDNVDVKFDIYKIDDKLYAKIDDFELFNLTIRE